MLSLTLFAVAIFSPEGTADTSPGLQPGQFSQSDSPSPARGGTKHVATGCVAPSGLGWAIKTRFPGLKPGAIICRRSAATIRSELK